MSKILVSAEPLIFTASHEQGPTDGGGGTVKRLAARTSLQRVYSNQIQNISWTLILLQQQHIQEEQIFSYEKELGA